MKFEYNMDYKLRFKHPVEDLVMHDNGRDVKTQSKVYGTNRYYFLFIVLFGLLVLGRFMWSFSPFIEIFVREKAYEWLCSGDNVTKANLPENVNYKCLQQVLAINRIGVIAMGSTLFGSIFAALFNILIGAKITAMIGSGSIFFGMLLLGYSCQKFQAYIAGAVLIGFGADFILFPSFNVIYLFPGHELFVTSLLASAISVGMFIPYLMKIFVCILRMNFGKVMLIHSMFAMSLFFIQMFFFPPRRFYKQKELDDAYRFSSLESHERTQEKMAGNRSIGVRLLSMLDINENKIGVVKRSFCSLHYLLLILTYVIMIIGSTLYITMAAAKLDDKLMNKLALGTAFSFTICLMFAPFIDKIGSIYVIWYEGLLLFLAMMLAMVGTDGTKLGSIIVYSLFAAYYNGQIWIFIVESFDPEITTLLVGFVSIIAGTVMLLSPLVYELLMTNVQSLNGFMIFVLILVFMNIFVMLALHIIKMKRPKIE